MLIIITIVTYRFVATKFNSIIASSKIVDSIARRFVFCAPLLSHIAIVLKTNITMWTVSTAAFFVWSQLFSTVTADKATIVPVQYMYMHTFGAGNAVTERNAGYGAAIGIILCVCVVIVFSICNKLIKDDDLEF